MALQLALRPFRLLRQLLFPEAEKYAYQPLEDGEIRLLQLLPGRGRMRLEAKMETIQLKDEKRHDFEALSYVWGGELKPEVIYVGGAPIRITASLSLFLHRLRLPNQPRRLWADAVCINQVDTEEKGRQIALMAEIYTVAARVMVDLGEGTLDSSLAIELLDRSWRRQIWSGFEVTGSNGVILSPEDTATYFNLELPPERDELSAAAADDGTPRYAWLQKQTVMGRLWESYCWLGLLAEFHAGFRLPGVRCGLGPGEVPPSHDSRWISVNNLFARPWFSRVWVIQEFVLGKEVVLVCGKRECRWQHLHAGLYPFTSGTTTSHLAIGPSSMGGNLAFRCMCVVRQVRLLRKTEQGRAFLLRTADLGYLWRKFQEIHLIDALHYFRISSVKVDKDRYFALLSIADDVVEDGKKQLELLYTAPLADTVVRVGRFLIRGAYGGEMLGRAGLWQRRDDETPSWIESFGTPQGILAMADPTVIVNVERRSGAGAFHVTTLPVKGDRPVPRVDDEPAAAGEDGDRGVASVNENLAAASVDEDLAAASEDGGLVVASEDGGLVVASVNVDSPAASEDGKRVVKGVNVGSRAAEFIMLHGRRLDRVDTEPIRTPLAKMEILDTDAFGALLEYVPTAMRALVGDSDGSEVRYFNGERITAAACATLISDTSLTPRAPSELEAGFHLLSWASVARNNPRADAWALQRVAQRFGVSRDEGWLIYHNYRVNMLMSVISHQRLPARTRKGYFANLPSCFEAGDEIWAVKGCRTPLLLRRSRKFPGCYQLVGGCYVHGFMDGEALEQEGFPYEQVSLH